VIANAWASPGPIAEYAATVLPEALVEGIHDLLAALTSLQPPSYVNIQLDSGLHREGKTDNDETCTRACEQAAV